MRHSCAWSTSLENQVKFCFLIDKVANTWVISKDLTWFCGSECPRREIVTERFLQSEHLCRFVLVQILVKYQWCNEVFEQTCKYLCRKFLLGNIHNTSSGNYSFCSDNPVIVVQLIMWQNNHRSNTILPCCAYCQTAPVRYYSRQSWDETHSNCAPARLQQLLDVRRYSPHYWNNSCNYIVRSRGRKKSIHNI